MFSPSRINHLYKLLASPPAISGNLPYVFKKLPCITLITQKKERPDELSPQSLLLTAPDTI